MWLVRKSCSKLPEIYSPVQSEIADDSEILLFPTTTTSSTLQGLHPGPIFFVTFMNNHLTVTTTLMVLFTDDAVLHDVVSVI